MSIDPLFVEICIATLCLTTVGLHLAHKNRNEALLYAVQSLAVVALLAYPLFGHFSAALLAVAVLTLLVKVVAAPLFFMRLVRRHDIKLTAKTYANVPATIALIVLILVLAGSGIFAPVTDIVPENRDFLKFALAAIFVSLLLMINRRGALSQIVGVLSLENAIVAFAVLAGLEQSAVLQAGIIFDITMWLVVAVTMVSLVYRHHGSLDISKLKRLKG